MKKEIFSNNKLIKYFEKILTSLIILLGFTLVGINTIQILLRGFYKSSLLWILEVSEFLGIWIVLFGASIMFLRNSEVKVTAIVNAFPKTIRRKIEVFISILGIVFSFFLIYGNIHYQKFVSIIKPDYLPFSFQVHIFPIFILGLCMIYNCLYIIFKQEENDDKEVFLE